MRGCVLVTIFVFVFGANTAIAAVDALDPKSVDWPFSGALGRFDEDSLRKGLDIYLNACSYCHSLKFVAYRNLIDIGISENEAKKIAAQNLFKDGPNEIGEMFDRPGRLSDKFFSPFPNDQAARFANGGALPPDLSLIVKSRRNGPNYIYSLLTGYGELPPQDFELLQGMQYNSYFPGRQIAMPPPLYEGFVNNAQGTPATIEEMAYDVTQFLSWAAEPKMDIRKRLGLNVIIFLIILTGLFIAIKRQVWKDIH